MMQRQQKARAGAGRLARKLGPAFWIIATVAAALIAGSCTGRPAAPAADPLRAGVVVAVANRPETAGPGGALLTSKSTGVTEIQTGRVTAPLDMPIRETPVISSAASSVDLSVTRAVQPWAAPPAAAQEVTTQTASVPTATPAPSATRIFVTLAPTVTPALPTSTPAPPPQFVVLENANVRRGPGTAYPIIGGLAAEQSYPVTARNQDGSWLEFDYASAAGWISAALVRKAGDFSTLPVAAHIPPPPPSPTKALPTRTPVPGPSDPVIADLVGRINKARADAGLNQLSWAPELAQAAGAHTWDMATHHFFGHTGSDGSDVTVRMRRAGYIPVWWGEILTHVNGGGGPDAAFSQFWNSPHHHDIILGDKFTDIGAAWIKDPADGSFNYYAVVFGRR